jgi:hypothetical protein
LQLLSGRIEICGGHYIVPLDTESPDCCQQGVSASLRCLFAFLRVNSLYRQQSQPRLLSHQRCQVLQYRQTDLIHTILASIGAGTPRRIDRAEKIEND